VIAVKESVSGTILHVKSMDMLARVESLLSTLAVLVALLLPVLVLKTNSTTVESPGDRTFFRTGARVHPHPGLTSILRVSSPTFLIQ
jgi:hypothetical protein